MDINSSESEDSESGYEDAEPPVACSPVRVKSEPHDELRTVSQEPGVASVDSSRPASDAGAASGAVSGASSGVASVNSAPPASGAASGPASGVGSRAGSGAASGSPAPPARFPPHDLVIDAEEQQWVYYTTQQDGESVAKIAKSFITCAQELVESNVSRCPGLGARSKLRKGTDLVMGACDALLVCSTCRGDDRPQDQVIICDGECGRAYHQSCLKLAEVPTGDWFCRFCVAQISGKRMRPQKEAWYKRPSTSSDWSPMDGDDAPPRVARRSAPLREEPSAPPPKAAAVKAEEEPGTQLTPHSTQLAPRGSTQPVPPSAQSGAPRNHSNAKHRAALQASPVPAPLALSPAPPGPQAAVERSFKDKVIRIKHEFGIADGLPIPAALTRANELMGLPSSGTLPAQVDALMRALFGGAGTG